MYPNQTIKVMFQAHNTASILDIILNGIFMEPLFVNIDNSKYKFMFQSFTLENSSMQIDIE